MEHFSYSCQGESHKATGKPCQDWSYSNANKDYALAIVSDGHGGERYFRSEKGAHLAVKCARVCVTEFIKKSPPGVFSNPRQADEAMHQLFASIIYRWGVAIGKHNKGKGVELLPDDGLEKTYGCTLMCFVVTPQYWFGFHIGDGKCIAFDRHGEWSEPIPWDDRCFLNRTTSLCDSNAINEFRCCYGPPETAPMAVFLASDGVDDSLGEAENIVNFYIQVLKSARAEGNTKARHEVEDALPELGRRGSKDDMSLACLYDPQFIDKGIRPLIAWQLRNVEGDIRQTNERIVALRQKLADLKAKGRMERRDEIDHDYAQKSLRQCLATRQALVNKWNRFSVELHGDQHRPYTDDIALTEG